MRHPPIKNVCDLKHSEMMSVDCLWCVLASRGSLLNAIIDHHAQKADDRCIEDDDKLYAAAGLPPCDRRVGDKFEMLKNCFRFVDRRCQGGGWPTYVELEREIVRLNELLKATRSP